MLIIATMDTDFEEKFLQGFRILFLWGSCLILNIITLLLAHFKLKAHTGVVALRYNVVTGVNWYGQGYNLYFIPAIAFTLLVVNFLLYRSFLGHQRFLALVTLFVTMVVELVLLVFILFLSGVN